MRIYQTAMQSSLCHRQSISLHNGSQKLVLVYHKFVVGQIFCGGSIFLMVSRITNKSFRITNHMHHILYILYITSYANLFCYKNLTGQIFITKSPHKVKKLTMMMTTRMLIILNFNFEKDLNVWQIKNVIFQKQNVLRIQNNYPGSQKKVRV